MPDQTVPPLVSGESENLADVDPRGAVRAKDRRLPAIAQGPSILRRRGKVQRASTTSVRDGFGFFRAVVWLVLALLIGMPLAALTLQGTSTQALAIFADPAVGQAALNSLASAGGSAT